MKVIAEIASIFYKRTDMLKAAANVILENSDGERFVIKNVRVVEDEHGLFMSLPSRRNINNEYKEICYPLSGNLRKRMSDAVLKAYQSAVNTNGQDNSPPAA